MSSTIPLSPTQPHHYNIPTRTSPAEEQRLQQEQQQQQQTHGTVAEMIAAVPVAPSLDTIIRDIVKCDDELCPDYLGRLSLIQNVLLEQRFPRVLSTYYHCVRTNPDPDKNCGHIYEGGLERVAPIMNGLLNHERIKTKTDPLLNYNAAFYLHSFWYQGIGDIWRRVSNESRVVTVADCQTVIRESERCFTDPKKVKDGTCFKLYGEALACETGANCTYLQEPMIACLSRKKIIDSGNYEKMKDCLFDIPNFQLCRTQIVPMSPEVASELGIQYEEGAT